MNKKQRQIIEELFGEYWDIAFIEGSTGENRYDDASFVLHRLNAVLNDIERSESGVDVFAKKVLKNMEYGKISSGCVLNPLSSRVCEMGTKCCDVTHSEYNDV